MSIAILGTNGMLGSMLVDYLRDYYDIIATVRDKSYKIPGVRMRYLDAVNSNDNEIAKAIDGCDWVINAIGSIPQRDRKHYLEVNTDFPVRLAFVADCRIIQIATDCVYSGEKGNYDEMSAMNPVDEYGQSKMFGEPLNDNVYHLRCSIIGKEPVGNYSLLSWFLSQATNSTIDGYYNHLWNGITTLQFAKICRGIIEYKIPIPQKHHVVPADIVSKYELLKIFATSFNRPDIRIRPIYKIPRIDRTLSTINPELNNLLWGKAGYHIPPTIAAMVNGFKEYNK